MNGRGLDDRDMDDIGSEYDLRLAKRVMASLQHPDCPISMFEAVSLSGQRRERWR